MLFFTPNVHYLQMSQCITEWKNCFSIPLSIFTLLALQLVSVEQEEGSLPPYNQVMPAFLAVARWCT